MGQRRHRWLAMFLVTLAACSEEVRAWRVSASCPVQPDGSRQLEFGRTHTLRIDDPLFGDPPLDAELIEDGRVAGRVALECVVTQVPLDKPRWIAPGGARLLEQPSAEATVLGRLERDAPVHSVARDGDWEVVAVGGVPAGFVSAGSLVERPADTALLPEFLVIAYAAGGAQRIVEVLPDLKQKEREDPRVAQALADLIGSALDAGERSGARRVLDALDHDELTAEPFRNVACRLALSGHATSWDIGTDVGAPCPGAPKLPEGYDVPIETVRECPRDTELLGIATSGAGTVWACYTPDAVLLNRPRGSEVDLSYESRLDHIFVLDRHGHIQDLIDDSGYIQARREGRWVFRAIHPVGLGACLEWEDSAKSKSMRFLSCFPPPPTSPSGNRELVKVAATRRDGTSWRKTWTVGRDARSYVLCLRGDAKGNEAYRFLPGQIKKARRWPAACNVNDWVEPATE